VRILDLSGRAVRTLQSGALSAGEHPLSWDLKDDSGRRVAPGLYFLVARGGAFQATQRLTVVH
jgi:flagellar hook assembly protein FlgD